MEKLNEIFFKSKEPIIRQQQKLFHRPFRYVVRSDQLESNKRIDDVFFYQVDVVMLFKQSLLTQKFLFEVFKKALQDMIVRLELHNYTLLNVPFYIHHSYYIFTKDEVKGTFGYFKNHGNTSDPYITDTVQFVNGIYQLSEYYIEKYILLINHLETAREFFKEQFENSSVIVDSISHIAFYIQPHDTSTAIRKKLFHMNESLDTYVE